MMPPIPTRTDSALGSMWTVRGSGGRLGTVLRLHDQPDAFHARRIRDGARATFRSLPAALEYIHAGRN